MYPRSLYLKHLKGFKVNKLRLLSAIPLTFMLSGCFDGYMDCDDSDNVDLMEEVLFSAVKSKVKYSLHFFGDLRYVPDFELRSFEQISSSTTVNQCSYEFTGIIEDKEIALKASSKIIKIDKGDRNHKVVDIDYSSYSIANLASIARELTQEDIYAEETLKFGFDNVDQYKSFLSLKDQKSKLASKKVKLESEKEKKNEEIKNTLLEIEKQSKRLSEYKKNIELELKKTEKPKFTPYTFVFTVDNLNLEERTFKVSFENPEKYELESVSFELYLYEKGKYDKPIFPKSTGKSLRAERTTHLRATFDSFGTYDESGSKDFNFSRDLNRELDRIKSKISNIKNIETLLIPYHYNIKGKYRKLHENFNIVAKYSDKNSEVSELKRDLKYKEWELSRLNGEINNLSENISEIEKKANSFSSNKTLEI